jgi:membrane associated rhomboid family serine protease
MRALLTINVVAYLAWQILRLFDPIEGFVWNHLALNPDLPGILLEPWQLVTYNFLHLSGGLGGLIHIGFNMLWLYWIGKEYEEMHGAERMYALYMIGGVGGGLLTVILHNLLPGLGLFSGVVHGASASVVGLLLAVGVLYPYKKIRLFLLGTWKLLYIVIGFLIIDFLFALTGSTSSISAHWGGALGGFLFARAERGGVDVTSWAGVFVGGRKRRKKKKKTWVDRIEDWLTGAEPETTEAEGGSSSRPGRSSSRAAEEEVDRILDKISEQGYDALSDEEKRILKDASQRS